MSDPDYIVIRGTGSVLDGIWFDRAALPLRTVHTPDGGQVALEPRDGLESRPTDGAVAQVWGPPENWHPSLGPGERFETKGERLTMVSPPSQSFSVPETELSTGLLVDALKEALRIASEQRNVVIGYVMTIGRALASAPSDIEAARTALNSALGYIGDIGAA